MTAQEIVDTCPHVTGAPQKYPPKWACADCIAAALQAAEERAEQAELERDDFQAVIRLRGEELARQRAVVEGLRRALMTIANARRCHGCDVQEFAENTLAALAAPEGET